MVSQLRDLVVRIDAVEQEQKFFELEISTPFSPTPSHVFESQDIHLIDDHLQDAIEVYTEKVNHIKDQKFQSPLYQRCIGIYGILQELGISVSNFRIFDLDREFLVELHRLIVLRVVQLENIGTQEQKPLMNVKENTRTFEKCSDLLCSLTHLMSRVVELEERITRDQNTTLPGFDEILGEHDG
jgi:hypothetical protein